MKKYICLIIMLLFAFTACDSNEINTESENKNQDQYIEMGSSTENEIEKFRFFHKATTAIIVQNTTTGERKIISNIDVIKKIDVELKDVELQEGVAIENITEYPMRGGYRIETLENDSYKKSEVVVYSDVILIGDKMWENTSELLDFLNEIWNEKINSQNMLDK